MKYVLASLVCGAVFAGCSGARQAVRPPEAPPRQQVAVAEEAAGLRLAEWTLLRVADGAKVRFCPVWGEPYPGDKAFCLIHGARLRPEAPPAFREASFARADE